MKKLYIIANWKSYKTSQEAKKWLQDLSKFQFPNSTEKEVIVCVPYTLLPTMKAIIDELHLPIKLGAQDISPFDEGAYTGEINGKQIKEFVDYTIIGHSERRKYFGEDSALLAQKVANALNNAITPIFCIQDENTDIPDGVTIVAYEPITAIGTGHPDTPENAGKVIKTVKGKFQNIQAALYGGSVNGDVVASFTQSENIDGALIGGASLDVQKFIDIITNS